MTSPRHPAVEAAEDLARRHGIDVQNGHHGESASTGTPVSNTPPISLAEIQALFQRHLYLPDPGILYVSLATVAANMADGDPVWAMFIAPPGGGKTEVLQAFIGLPHVRGAATVTESALLSGTPKRDKAGDAKGGLLREIGEFGILILKDFGSMLSMNREARAAVLAALREIFDGSWTRHVGTDGGRSLSWIGKLGLLAGATPTVDQLHGAIAALGERFLTYRVPQIGAEEQARKALSNIGSIAKIRRELAEAVRGFFAGIDGLPVPELSPEDMQGLVDLSVFAVRARSSVERDPYHNREIELIPDPEAPGRMAGTLARLYLAMIRIGLPATEARPLIAKVAQDCMPSTRCTVLSFLLNQLDATETSQIAEHVGYPTNTARRTLEDLTAHGIVERIRAEKQGKADRWRVSAWTQDQHKRIAAWVTVPEMSEGMRIPSSSISLFTISTDFSGTPPSTDTNPDTKQGAFPDTVNLADTKTPLNLPPAASPTASSTHREPEYLEV